MGLATAFKLKKRNASYHITILEKEAQVARHQTGHNSGVLHTGLYYQPGTSKAVLAVRGIREMVAFCRENDIAHEVCGKLVVAADESETPRLRKLHERGIKNGLQGLELLSPKEMKQIEPHVVGVLGLRVPQAGIVDYTQVCLALRRLVENQGGRVTTGAKALGTRRLGARWVIETSQGPVETDFLVNCAGLHSDRVCKMSGQRPKERIIPFRGEYYQLKPDRQHLVRHLIYPTPDPQFPFLGVHFTRMIHGGVEAGPNAVLALAREAYRKTDWKLRDAFEALSFAGLWRFCLKHRRMTWEELSRSFSKRRFCQALQKLVPELRLDDLERGGAGVRAQAMTPEGELVQDFRFVHGPNSLHVLNAPSPAATASLAIGEEISARIDPS